MEEALRYRVEIGRIERDKNGQVEGVKTRDTRIDSHREIKQLDTFKENWWKDVPFL